MWVKPLFYEGKTGLEDKYNNNSNNSNNVSTVDLYEFHTQWVYMWWWQPLGSFSLHWIGPAAFQFRVSLTIELRVAVNHRGDSDQHLSFVSLHHQLQLSARLLDQLACVTQRQVLCHCTINLTERERGDVYQCAPKKQCYSKSPVQDSNSTVVERSNIKIFEKKSSLFLIYLKNVFKNTVGLDKYFRCGC